MLCSNLIADPIACLALQGKPSAISTSLTTKPMGKGPTGDGDSGNNTKGLALSSPFNTLLESCYTVHVSIPYFKYSDMVAVILKRCTGKISEMSRTLYGISVLLLILYASVAAKSQYLPLAWLNIFAILNLDMVHYLLGRGSNAWPPGRDVAILSGGRMFITVICGKYWLAGYSFAYMLYGYALTDAIITKYLPYMSKADAGAVAFFGSEEYLRTNFDMASSPEFCFSFLSFMFVALLLCIAYTKPSALPLPMINVGGSSWPVYVFGIMAFLFILISCFSRATFRALYLYRENLLMGTFRDAYFWSSRVRVPVVLAVLTQVINMRGVPRSLEYPLAHIIALLILPSADSGDMRGPANLCLYYRFHHLRPLNFLASHHHLLGIPLCTMGH